MINIIYLLFIHWIADFITQTDRQAKGKSKSIDCLLSHIFCYTIVLTTFGSCIIFKSSIIDIILFISINSISHGIIDYFTSKINSYLWSKGDVHNFFVSIGFDQFLHISILFISYNYIILGVV